jgi:hypothetical protein
MTFNSVGEAAYAVGERNLDMSEQQEKPEALADTIYDETSLAERVLQRMARTNRWMILLACIMTVGVGTGGFLFSRQIEVAGDQVEAIQTSAERMRYTVNAINRRTKVAEKANEIAAKALSSSARPWAGLDMVLAGTIHANQKFEIKPTIRNSGRSPAFKLRGHFKAMIQQTKALSIADIGECDHCPRTIVLPNIGFAYDASVPAEALAPDVVDEIKRGDKTILVVGRIDYEDANDGRHATKICISYFPQISGFSACAEGNYLN